MKKYQRTGLTEGSLIFNEWLKTKGLYRKDTEDEFINWLYSTAGWYDSEIKGSYFDIDVDSVRKSEVYKRFLIEFRDSLLNSEWFHLMIHSAYHLNGQHLQSQFASQFSETNYCYWKDVPFLKDLIKGKKVLILSSIAPLIEEKYHIKGYRTPETYFNKGQDKNSFETLERIMSEIPKDFDFALVSAGPYGCFLVDRIVKLGKSAATIGSGVYDLFPVEIPDEFKPKGYLKIENGRYWKNSTSGGTR